MAAYPPNAASLALAEADEQELILASRDRDVKAFEELYRRYRRAVRELCMKSIGDPTVAEDLTQETFTRAFTHIERFRDGSRFWPWIAAIARNLCVDVLRVSPRCTPAEIQDEDTFAGSLPVERIDVSDHVIRRHEAAGMRARLAAALGVLSPRERRILWLKHAEGWTYEEIARVDGTSVDATRNAAYRARGTARVFLQTSGAGTPALGLVPAIILALRLRVREAAVKVAHRFGFGPTHATLGERACAAFMAVSVLSVIWVVDGAPMRRANASELQGARRTASVSTPMVEPGAPTRVAHSNRGASAVETTVASASTEAVSASVEMRQRSKAAAPSKSNVKFEVRDPQGNEIYSTETWFECEGEMRAAPSWSPVTAYC